MEIGKLNKRIDLMHLVDGGKDEFGAEIKSFEKLKSVWASAQPLSGKEYFIAKQVNEESTVRFTIRYMKTLDTNMIVLFGGKSYDIKGIINENGKNIKLILLCKETEQDGEV